MCVCVCVCVCGEGGGLEDDDLVNETATQSDTILHLITNTKSDSLTGVLHWPYLYYVFNICTFWLNKKKTKNTTLDFRSGNIEMYSLETN